MLCDVYTIYTLISTQDIVHVKLDYGPRVGVMQGVKSNPAHKWFCIDKVGHSMTVDMQVDTNISTEL